ncbi:16312_t:CDS:1, partial [Gigaspora rosea]
ITKRKRYGVVPLSAGPYALKEAKVIMSKNLKPNHESKFYSLPSTAWNHPKQICATKYIRRIYGFENIRQLN